MLDVFQGSGAGHSLCWNLLIMGDLMPSGEILKQKKKSIIKIIL